MSQITLYLDDATQALVEQAAHPRQPRQRAGHVDDAAPRPGQGRSWV